MDTPIIALYYRESDPMKRKMFLDQSIAAGEEEEANAIRKELWEIRYGGKSEVPDTPADGYLALWMALEFNKNASSRLFGAKSARREIVKNLQKMKITEYQGKSALHQELLFRECCHMVRTTWNCAKRIKLIIPRCAVLFLSVKKVQRTSFTVISMRQQYRFLQTSTCRKNWESSQGRRRQPTRIISLEKADYKKKFRRN